MQILYPFVDSALPLAYGVLGVQIFHVCNVLYLEITLNTSISDETAWIRQNTSFRFKKKKEI